MADLTDLEITAACARAMGITHEVNTDSHGVEFVEIIQSRNPGNGGEYDPLHNDAQAMALVKRFNIGWDKEADYDWHVALRAGNTLFHAHEADLNRAICLCVARMQLAKEAK